MSGTLYLVATPIGNLADITLRALDTLKAADYIACEDTRHSRVLLDYYEIKKPVFSYHMHNERSCSEYCLRLLNEGKNIALITDAGTPCISDPGSIVVKAVRAAGISVQTVPGASAVVSAVSLCGIEGGFTFVGFLPEKQSQRRELLQQLRYLPTTAVFYISPHSLMKDVKSVLEAWGDRVAFVVKELTKIHESVTETTLATFAEDSPRGEYVLLVQPQLQGENQLLGLSVQQHLQHYLQLGYDKKEAVKLVASERGVAKNEVYQIALKL